MTVLAGFFLLEVEAGAEEAGAEEAGPEEAGPEEAGAEDITEKVSSV